jgi:hypothetical protein
MSSRMRLRLARHSVSLPGLRLAPHPAPWHSGTLAPGTLAPGTQVPRHPYRLNAIAIIDRITLIRIDVAMGK